MFRIGLSSCGKVIDEKLFEDYKNAGISAFEISVSNTEEQKEIDFKNIKALSEKFGIELWTAHLPFGNFSVIDISNPEIADFSVSYLSELIKQYSEIGVTRFVVHPSGEPIADSDRKMRMECAKKSLQKLVEVADKFGGVIAVEDLPRTCLGRDSKEILELISADERLRVCFDTNHLLTENPVDFIRTVGDKIITLHVSDYDFIDERHWMPGEGKINWSELVSALKDVNYSGVWLYELVFESTKTIKRPKNLTCEDFAQNAKAVLRQK